MQALRGTVAPERAARAARAVRDHLLADRRLQAAPRVALYAARGGELPTRPLFDALMGRRPLLLPRCRSDATLAFAAVERWEDLSPGRYGVLEPSEGAPTMTLGEEDVVLVPGLAFDAAGHRLGRGVGYYDRSFAAGARAPRLIGVAYDVQLVASVPRGEHDRDVDAICTESGLCEAGEERS